MYRSGRTITLLSPQDVFHWLLGEWTLSREAPGHASIQGRASIVPIEREAALYYETVTVQLVNRSETLHAEQRYEYRQTEQGLVVYFARPSLEAGELFHVLEFSAHDGHLLAHAHHQCKADLYVSEYIVPIDGKTNRFTVRHDVEGPAKRYSLLSVYVRS